jgi:hypothetical protein
MEAVGNGTACLVVPPRLLKRRPGTGVFYGQTFPPMFALSRVPWLHEMGHYDLYIEPMTEEATKFLERKLAKKRRGK